MSVRMYAFVLNWWYRWVRQPRQYTTTLLALSLYYSVQMRDGACVHTAWKTHFQRRKSGFETCSPPTPLGQPIQTLCVFKCRNPKSEKTGKAVWLFDRVLKSCLHPITLILSHRIYFIIKQFRSMSWFMLQRKISRYQWLDFSTFM